MNVNVLFMKYVVFSQKRLSTAIFRGLTSNLSSQSGYPNYLFGRILYVCQCSNTSRYLFGQGLENTSQDPAWKDLQLTNNISRFILSRMLL